MQNRFIIDYFHSVIEMGGGGFSTNILPFAKVQKRDQDNFWYVFLENPSDNSV